MIIFGVVDKRSCSKLSRLVLAVCFEWIRIISLLTRTSDAVELFCVRFSLDKGSNGFFLGGVESDRGVRGDGGDGGLSEFMAVTQGAR